MDVLDKVYESLEFKELGKVIKDIYLGKKDISYDEFKDLIISFGLKVMKTYLEENALQDEMYSFLIEKGTHISGSYYPEINEIVINDLEIKKII